MSSASSTPCPCAKLEPWCITRVTCAECRKNDRLRQPLLHPVLYHGSVVCYDRKSCILGQLLAHERIESHAREPSIKCTYAPDSSFLVIDTRATLHARSSLALETAKLIDDFFPVQSMLWTVVGEYVHGIVSYGEEGSRWSCGFAHNPWGPGVIRRAQVGFNADMHCHRQTSMPVRDLCAHVHGLTLRKQLRDDTQAKQVAHQKAMREAAAKRHQRDIHNDLLSRIRGATAVGSTASWFLSATPEAQKPQPTLTDNDFTPKFIDVRELELKYIDAMMPAMITAHLCPVAQACHDDDDQDVYDVFDLKRPPTPQGDMVIAQAYVRPSTPVTDRERELDAQDDAFLEHIQPRIAARARAHAERLCAIANFRG